MMYIMMKNPEYNLESNSSIRTISASKPPQILELHWYVGNPLPDPLNDRNKHLIVALQADGDELELIRNKIDNLVRMKNARVQTWRGEMAQFIVDNLIG